MATDSKISKNVSKSIGRAKEKILQNLGKVDRTADEIFDEHVGNFTKQQYAATRLQKELNNYIRCIRATATANRSLMEAVAEIYEPEWGGKEQLTQDGQTTEMLWNDFAHRLAEQVLIPLNTYQGQFPEMRKKIEKRGRKLVDFDGERHSLQALQSNPRRAEGKLAKQRESLEGAKRTYEVLNTELHEELPGLYNSRIVFLVSAMSTLFASENIFHSESNKIYNDLEGVVERLARETAKGTLNFKSSNAILNNSSEGHSEGEVSPTTPKSPEVIAVIGEIGDRSSSPNASASLPGDEKCAGANTNNNTQTSVVTNGVAPHGPTDSEGGPTEKDVCDDGGVNGSSSPGPKSQQRQKNGRQSPSEEKGRSKASSETRPQKPASEDSGILCRVRATYRYQREDVDELSFEAGEVIRVVEYDDPEEQEEGWLMGIKENGEKGMFPANFTRPM